MGKKRITDLSEEQDIKSPKEEKVTVAEQINEAAEANKVKGTKTPRPPKSRGKKYLEARSKIDREKTYSINEALKLMKETSVTKFIGTAEVHLVMNKGGQKGEMELPHFKGEDRRVEIASEETLKKLAGGKIDFDVLLTTPQMMPQLAKYAKLLGPKGLMPNPKSGTVVEDPAKVAKNFEKPTLKYKAEANNPLIHLLFGKVNQPEEELKANLQAVLKALGGAANVKKISINASMGPGIKVSL